MNNKIKNFMFNKLELIKMQPYLYAFLAVVLLVCIPLLIWFCYFVGDSGLIIVSTSLTVGDALGFYGNLLTFLGTMSLGALALLQNIKANEINRKMLDSDLVKNFHTYLFPKYLFILPCPPSGKCTNTLICGKVGTETNAGYVRFQINFISSNRHPIKSAKILKFEIKDDTREPFLWIGTYCNFSFCSHKEIINTSTHSAFSGNNGNELDANFVIIGFETYLKKLLNQEQIDEESICDFSNYGNLKITLYLSFVNIFDVETTVTYILYCKKDSSYHDPYSSRYIFFEEEKRISNTIIESIKVVH